MATPETIAKQRDAEQKEEDGDHLVRAWGVHAGGLEEQLVDQDRGRGEVFARGVQEGAHAPAPAVEQEAQQWITGGANVETQTGLAEDDNQEGSSQ